MARVSLLAGVAQPFIAHEKQTIVLIGTNTFGHVLNVHWLIRSSVQVSNVHEMPCSEYPKKNHFAVAVTNG